MKIILTILFILPITLLAQVREYEGEKFLEFTTHFPYDSSSLTGIDWKQEKLEATVTLQGKNPLTYNIKPVNDTVIEIWQLRDNKWKRQEKITYFGWALHRWDDEAGKILSELKITDFDHDGDEDLVCWVTSNVNGNVWTIIFINDNEKQKLVKLKSKADYNSDIWDAPTFDPATGLIHTELFSSANGTQNTATYKLNGTVVTPVLKEETDMGNPDYFLYTTYEGKKGKWKKVGETKEEIEANGYVALEKEGYIMFEFEDIFDPQTGELDIKGQEIYNNVTLKGKTPLEYQVKLIDGNTAVLLQYIDKDWVAQDTLECAINKWEFREGWPLVSTFRVTDFNKDGNEDLVYSEIRGGHNAITALVYINSQKRGKLVKLYNPAEETYLWDDPQYDIKSKTITTSVSGGLHGMHTNTSYKLKDAKVTPLTKTEIDHTDENTGIERTYKYKKGRWELKNGKK